MESSESIVYTPATRGLGMTTVLISHRVADYDAWRAIYDEVTAGPPALVLGR